MSHYLELLGRGLNTDVGEMLRPFYWSPLPDDIARLRAAVKSKPDCPERRLQFGLAQLRDGQPDKALKQLNRACELKAGSRPILLATAVALLDSGRLEEALEHLRASARLGPAEGAVLWAIGLCLEKLDRPAEAGRTYREAVEADGNCVPARERLAAVALVAGEVEEAISQYDALRRIDPQEAWLRSVLGHLCYSAGQYPEALEEFESAIVMEPENWALVDDGVESLVSAGRIDEAIERLKVLISEQGPFADLYVRLGDLYSQSSDDENALANYRSALEIQPAYLEATVKLGTHHMVNGRWEEAAESFYQACELNDRVLMNYVGMGVVQAAMGKREEAMNSFDLAAAVEPNSSLLLAETVRLQLKASMADDLARSFEAGDGPSGRQIDLDADTLLQRQLARHREQVRTQPDAADVRYRYGVLLRFDKKLLEAKDQFAKAAELSPGHVLPKLKLAITNQELGLIDGALRTFTEAMNPPMQCLETHYKLGVMYTDRERFGRFVESMEAAADDGGDRRQIRASLALSLQNMGLMDRAAATWRSLCQMHHAGT